MKTASGRGPGTLPNNAGNTTGPGISLPSERNTTGSANAKNAKQPGKPAGAGTAQTLLSPTAADAKPAPKSTGSPLPPGEPGKNPNESSTNKLTRQTQHSIRDPKQENLKAREPITSNTNAGNSKPPRPSANVSTALSPQYPDRPGASHALRSTASAAARTTETDGQGRKLNNNSPAAMEQTTRPMQTNPSDRTSRRIFFEMHSARIGRLYKPFLDQQNTCSGLVKDRRIGETLYTSEGIAPEGLRANSSPRTRFSGQISRITTMSYLVGFC